MSRGLVTKPLLTLELTDFVALVLSAGRRILMIKLWASYLIFGKNAPAPTKILPSALFPPLARLSGLRFYVS